MTENFGVYINKTLSLDGLRLCTANLLAINIVEALSEFKNRDENICISVIDMNTNRIVRTIAIPKTN